MVASIQSFAKYKLQGLIASALFPSNRDDWYVLKGFSNEQNRVNNLAQPFAAFLAEQRLISGKYFENFKDLSLTQSFVKSQTAVAKPCLIERISFKPTEEYFNKYKDVAYPAKNKHIVYFTGVDTRYQDCFADISYAAKTTGASIHAFNYPGIKLHGGIIREAKDLVNSGIAMVNQLIADGVNIDDIILQGDSFGAAIAIEVKQQFWQQSEVKIRLIANNTFDTFESAVIDAIKSKCIIPNVLQYGVEPILRATSWDVRPGDDYGVDTPYQCHIQHIGDLTLPHSSLAGRVDLNKDDQDYIDPCPMEYLAYRARIASHNRAKIKDELVPYFEDKYGSNCAGEVDAHMADLCDLELPDGQDVYKVFVNDFLRSSQHYINSHPQKNEFQLPKFLTNSGLSMPINNSFFAYKSLSESSENMLDKKDFDGPVI